MKTPRFEELATRWQGKAQILFIFSNEAHPRARMGAMLNQMADRISAMDANHDGVVTLAEYKGPPGMFDTFDLDRNGEISTPEFLSTRRIDEFKDFNAPATYEERVKLARAFRQQVAGAVPLLVDEIDNRTSLAYGMLPNSAFVIGQDGVVKEKFPWAAVAPVEAALEKLTGAKVAAPPARKPSWKLVAAELAAAKKARRSLLVEFSALGCPSCKQMEETTLADAEVKKALGGFELAKLGVERDEAWQLFEALDLQSTPAFVIVKPDGTVKARTQGLQDKAAFLSLLSKKQ